MVLLAIIMAAMGIIGYRRGWRPELVNLGVLLAAFVAIEKNPQKLIDYMNGLFIGFTLLIKSGLSDLNAGDLDAAAAKLRAVDRPFQGDESGFALLLIMVAAAGLGYVLGRWIRKDASVAGAAVGVLNGYVLSAAFLPWLSGLSASDLPVPFIRQGQGLALRAGHGAGEATSGLSLPPVLEWLTLEGGLPLVVLIAALAVFAVWRARPRKAL